MAFRTILLALSALFALLVAIDARAAGREGMITAADSTLIAYDIRGKGEPALVFIHCWACNRAFWREQLDAFAPNHTVVSLDLPGHGASGRDRREWTLAAYADDVRRLVETLDLSRVVLVGHSMGGPVALLAAAELGERAAGVLCVDALHDAAFKMPAEAVRGWKESFARDYEGGMRTGIGAMVRDDAVLRAWIVDQALAADREAMMALIPEFATFRLAAALAAVSVPVRCINAIPYGGYSIPTAINLNRHYADFDALLMAGVGHYPQLERPEEFNALMRVMLLDMGGPWFPLTPMR